MLDGLYRMKNGDIIATDWVSGAVFQWNKKMGKHDLATGFKGPADLCAVPNDKGCWSSCPIWSKAKCASSSSANNAIDAALYSAGSEIPADFFHNSATATAGRPKSRRRA